LPSFYISFVAEKKRIRGFGVKMDKVRNEEITHHLQCLKDECNVDSPHKVL